MKFVTIFAVTVLSFPLNIKCQSFYDNPFTTDKPDATSHSIIIGAKFTMYNLILSRSEALSSGEKVNTHVTDGGAVAPSIMYRSPEKYFFEYSTPKGAVKAGYHL